MDVNNNTISKINKNVNNINSDILNGSDLAYVGDAYYELFVRTYLLSKGITKPQILHKMCTKYVRAETHAKIIRNIMDTLTEDEINAYHRGRNYNYRHRSKGSKLADYLLSSGFEAVIGYLFLSGKKERLDEILDLSISIIESE